MATETVLGIKVYTDRKTAGPRPNGDFRDIKGIVSECTKRFGSEEAHAKALKGRMKPHEQLVKLVNACAKKGVLGQNAIGSLALTLNLVTADPKDPGKYITQGNKRKKTLENNDVTNLDVKKYDPYDSHYETVRNALKCHTVQCKALQTQIVYLLAEYGNTYIDVKVAKKSNRNLKAWNLDYLPKKLKCHYKPSQFQVRDYIYALTRTDEYKTGKKDESVHAEILGGILFEAGNVYRGTGDVKSETAQKAAEVPVVLYNCLLAAVRAKKGIPLTQQEWRNLVTVYFTDVNLGTFQVTPKYKSMVLKTPWSTGGDYGGEKN